MRLDDRILEINDDFFRHIQGPPKYQLSMMPTEVNYLDSEYFPEPIPCLYGQGLYETEDNHLKLGFDLISTVFFCLSRWEETILEKDQYERILDEQSALVQLQIVDIPVVDYITHFIANYFQLQAPEEIFSYELVPTHDIDIHRYFSSPFSFLRSVIGDLIHRRKISWAAWTLQEGIKRLFTPQADPFDTIDLLMQMSEAKKAKSIFYFIPRKEKIAGASYDLTDPDVLKTIGAIQSRQHIIGIHPSIGTSTNKEKWANELDKLSSIVKVKHSRQHYLQYDITETTRIIDTLAPDLTDSSIHFRKYPGFRSGSCIPYHPYRLDSRSAASFLALPLVFMDQNIHYSSLTPQETLTSVKKIIDRVRLVKGKFVILWHNSSWNHPEWRSYQEYYQDLLNHATT